MSTLQRLWKGITQSCEFTSDDQKDHNLQTRYYAYPFKYIWQIVLSSLEKLKHFEIVHVLESRGEIILMKKTSTGRMIDTTLTISSVSPSKISIDIHSASRGRRGDAGASYRTINFLYAYLEQKF